MENVVEWNYGCFTAQPVLQPLWQRRNGRGFRAVNVSFVIAPQFSVNGLTAKITFPVHAFLRNAADACSAG